MDMPGSWCQGTARATQLKGRLNRWTVDFFLGIARDAPHLSVVPHSVALRSPVDVGQHDLVALLAGHPGDQDVAALTALVRTSCDRPVHRSRIHST